MLHRVIETIRQIHKPSGFEGYLMSVQRSAGAPSVEDARRDYRRMLRTETPLMW